MDNDYNNDEDWEPDGRQLLPETRNPKPETYPSAMRYSALILFVVVALVWAGGVVPLLGEPEASQAGATPRDDGWPCFGHDAQRTGRSSAEFENVPAAPTWTFRPGKPTWDYRKGISVWSPPVITKVEGQPRVFIGSYDHHLYCLDGLTGKKVWAFTAGDGVFASPTIVELAAGPVVIFGSADRAIYALSAKDGKKLWTIETHPWRDSVSPCRMSAGVVGAIEGKSCVFIGASNNDRSGLRNVQKGELLAIEAETGKTVWRKTLTSTFVTSPCLGRVGNGERLYVACQDGTVHAVRPESGEFVWTYRANERIWGSTSFSIVRDRPMVFFGTRHHSVYAVDAVTGERIWKHKCGYWVDSTPALAAVGGRTRAFFGSYDRGVHSVDASTGEPRWKAGTLSWVSSSAAMATLAGKLAAVIIGLDGRIYAFDASTGRKVWEFRGGDFPWSHIQQGDAVWPSPAAASFGPSRLLIYPSYSYQVHGFVEGAGE